MTIIRICHCKEFCSCELSNFCELNAERCDGLFSGGRERRPKIEMIIVVSDNMDMGENLLPNHFQKVYL